MKIAIASGKGGTGKTTVAVSLALVARQNAQLMDCDVEEPNAHIFLKGDLQSQRVVSIPVPVIDKQLCDGCGECSRFCQFNAIVIFGAEPILAPELCHGCGGCTRVCPQKAIQETDNRIGIIETFQNRHVTLVQGKLDIGVALAPPLIRAVKEAAHGDLVILDAPPGTSCPVIATLRNVDFVVLVTEPTPFGLNDLKLAVDVVRKMKIPFGIVVNRATEDSSFIRSYGEAENIKILAEITDDRRIAETYAKGEPLVEALPEYRSLFESLLRAVKPSETA